MSQFSMDAEYLARMLHHAADCIMFYDRVKSYHDCNDCGKKECVYMPRPGQFTRINCPLWEGKER